MIELFMVYLVFLLFILSFNIKAEPLPYDPICIGGDECKCICTYEPNPRMQALIKKGIAKRLCGCTKDGCDTNRLEKIPEFKIKKEDVELQKVPIIP